MYKNLKLKKVCSFMIIVLILAAFGSSTQVYAHPHMYFSTHATFVFGDEGLENINVSWVMDEYTTVLIFEGYDLDRDGVFSEEELTAYRDQEYSRIVNDGFYQHIKVNGEKIQLPSITNFRISVSEDKIVTYLFTIPLVIEGENEVTEVALAQYDETYFTDFVLSKAGALSVQNGEAYQAEMSIRVDGSVTYYDQFNPEETVVSFVAPEIVPVEEVVPVVEESEPVAEETEPVAEEVEETEPVAEEVEETEPVVEEVEETGPVVEEVEETEPVVEEVEETGPVVEEVEETEPVVEEVEETEPVAEEVEETEPVVEEVEETELVVEEVEETELVVEKVEETKPVVEEVEETEETGQSSETNIVTLAAPDTELTLFERINEVQVSIQSNILSLLNEAKEEGTIQPILFLMLLAFVYGIVHVAGPGHGKGLTISYVIADGKQLKKAMLLSIFIPVLHSISGIVVVFALTYLFQSSVLGAMDSVIGPTQLISYGLMILLGIWIIVKSIVEWRRGRAEEEKPRKGKFGVLWAALIVGMVPCPGVVFLLLIGNALGVLEIGILMALAMMLGMVIGLMALTYIAYVGRRFTTNLFEGNKVWSLRIENGLAVLGGTIIVTYASLFLMASFM